MRHKPVEQTLAEGKVVTNPNGSNQYEIDPREKLCLSLYLDPKSETFSNGLQSALKAGYPYTSANQITTQEWFKANTRKGRLLEKAERNLEKFIDLDTRKTVTTLGGESFKTEEEDPRLLEAQWKATEFIAKAIGKIGNDIDKPTENNITKIENQLVIIAQQVNGTDKERIISPESSQESLQGPERTTISFDTGTMQAICRNIREET